jgi:hypothetical protein
MPGGWTLSTLSLVLFLALAHLTRAQDVDALGHPWWQHAVFYELYPRSFADSDKANGGPALARRKTMLLVYIAKISR